MENVEYGCDCLYEFVTPIGKVRTRVKSLAEPIIDHLAKAILYKDIYPQYLDHWCKELYAFFVSCMKVKIQSTNRYPDSKQLKSWILEYYSDSSDMEGIKAYLAVKYGDNAFMSDEELYSKLVQALDQILPSVAERNIDWIKIKQIICD
jgi:hypothetical protein